MKKIVILMIALLGLVFASSCSCEEHTHIKELLHRDATHHWYSCTACAEQLQKTEHMWDKGVITRLPTENKDGVKVYTCAVCSYKRSESVKNVIETRVDEKGWEAAFNESSFVNASATIVDKHQRNGVEHKTVYTVKARGDVVYVTIVEYVNGREEKYSAKYQDGNYMWFFTDRNKTIEDVEPVIVSENEMMSATNIFKDYGLNLSTVYSQFTYNEGKGNYAVGELNVNNVSFTSIIVAMKNGKLGRVYATDTVGGIERTVEITVTDYDTAKPQPPKK